MEDEQPLTHPLFATEEENNIVTDMNTWVFPTPMARPHQETDQLVCSTPHRPRWRMEDGEMVCVVLASSPVLQEDTQPLPSQATMYQECRPDLLVCPPLPRDGGREIHQEEMVCVTVPASPLSYEERSEVVCVGWGRMARSLPHQTSNTTEPSSEVENNLGATGTHGHTTHHYTPQPLQLPTETTTLNMPVPFNANAHFSCECHSDEDGECRPKNGIPMEAVGDPSPTQQLVSGRIPRSSR